MSPEESHQPVEETTFDLPKKDAFKYQWSRYISRELYYEGVARVERKCFGENAPEHATLQKRIAVISGAVKEKRDIGLTPPRHGHFKVGIVGAGAAGLFTALALDWINDTIRRYKGAGKLKIEYEILEAASKDRFGGRLFTHHFSKDGTHDYYDVGAMRFPDNEVMSRYARRIKIYHFQQNQLTQKRSFRLFDYLDIKKGALGERTNVKDWPVLIPYYLSDEDKVCPSYFNNIQKTGSPWNNKLDIDPFELNEGVAVDKRIPDE